MESRFYQAQGINLEKLADDMSNMFLMQGYQAQHFSNRDSVMVQLKKGGELQALLGMQAALTVTMNRTPGGVLAVIGQQQWIDKAAAGAVGMLILWPLAFTAGAGAIRQSNLASQVLNTLDSLVRQQISNVQVSLAPDYMIAQAQQQMAQSMPPQYQQSQLPPAPPPPPQYQQSMPPVPQQYPPQQQQQQQRPPAPMPHYQPPAQQPPPVPMPHYQPPAQQPPPVPMPHYQPPARQQQAAPPAALLCPQCGARYDAGDTFCSHCGYSFVQQQQTCASCGAKLKPNATFCAQCGTPVNSVNTEERTVRIGNASAQPNAADIPWGHLSFSDDKQFALTGNTITVGRSSQDKESGGPEINLSGMSDANTVSRNHAVIEYANDSCTLTDLNSANSTRINGQPLEPNRATPFGDGDTLSFGKVACTFRKG
jgi:ribosomal protein L40E